MSTFNGLVPEFPDIRIDFFRANPNVRPPLACFLSHVHSDHLAGLESLRSPFVYCSAATREILLRLERYPCRINHARGVLEARQQTYKQLSKVLKPLPLDTPACLELRPGQQIQVTLLDANHCPGAVMFLIQGHGKAILYTGDIRSEPWFVNSISRNPNLIEYTHGLKTLDKIYLDTSFTTDIAFQTKAEGIKELLEKVSRYPDGTVFHFQAWTYGYEDVWIALSKALNSPVHVDDYKMKIYRSLQVRSPEGRFSSNMHLSTEAPALVGYMCGNSPHPGCLTSDPTVRLHSCEKGNMCATAQDPSVVRIQPVIAHLPSGSDLAEVGVGGGGDDLEREAEMDLAPQEHVQTLVESICASGVLSADAQDQVEHFLKQLAAHGHSLALDLDVSSLDHGHAASLESIIRTIIVKKSASGDLASALREAPAPETLPRTVTFPYSRHSSYPELCHLVDVFKPKDVWPCTVDHGEWVRNGVSISSLFGRYCSGSVFEHDLQMEALKEANAVNMPVDSQQRHSSTQPTDSQSRQESSPMLNPQDMPSTPPKGNNVLMPSANAEGAPYHLVSSLEETQAAVIATTNRTDVEMITISDGSGNDTNLGDATPRNTAENGVKRRFEEYMDEDDATCDHGESQQTERSFVSTLSMRHSISRREAYYQMLEEAGGDGWNGLGLLSTDGGHSVPEKEL